MLEYIKRKAEWEDKDKKPDFTEDMLNNGELSY